MPEVLRKAVVVHNGVDCQKFSPVESDAARAVLRKASSIPSDQVVVVNVAGFRPEKGHGVLIHAIDQLVKAGVNVRLRLIGDGELRPAIMGMTETLGLGNRVDFVGVTSRVDEELRMADISVIASTAIETFSNAMLESMATGLAVVSTNISGASEAIEDGNSGFLVSPGSVRELAEILERLALEPDARKQAGKSARKVVLDKFKNEFMIENRKKVIEGMLSPNS